MKIRFLLPIAAVLALLPACGDDAESSPPTPVPPGADAAADAQPGPDAGMDAPQADAPDDAPASQEASVDAPADVGPDTFAETGPEAGNDASSCTVDPQTPADGVRTVLTTHPYAGSGDACGRLVHVLRLDAEGKLTDTGNTLDVGDCPQRVHFSPDGRLAFVIVANHHNPGLGLQRVVVLRNDGQGNVSIVSEMPEFSLTNPIHVAFSLDGKKAYVPDTDLNSGAVHVIDVVPGCSATYAKKIPMPLPNQILPLPDGKHAIVIGNKEPDDVAIVDLVAETVVSNHDLYEDWTDAYSIALSPDGKYLAVPNSSPFSSLANTVSTLEIDSSGATPVPKLAYMLQNIDEPTGVAWALDGSKLAVSTFSGNSVKVLNAGADGVISVGSTITGIGLAGYMSMLSRGPNAGLMLVTSVTSVFTLRFTASGMEKMGEFSFGSGYDAMVNDVAIEP